MPAKHIINRDEFEQPPPAIQLFYRYFKAAGEKTEGEYLSPVEILGYLQKKNDYRFVFRQVLSFRETASKRGDTVPAHE